jgi:hypothetical protein
MWPFQAQKRDPLPKERLEAVEDDLRRLRHHLEDLEDVLGRRVDKLMHRARREQELEPGGKEAVPGGEVRTASKVDKRHMAALILRRGNGLLR